MKYAIWNVSNMQSTLVEPSSDINKECGRQKIATEGILFQKAIVMHDSANVKVFYFVLSYVRQWMMCFR